MQVPNLFDPVLSAAAQQTRINAGSTPTSFSPGRQLLHHESMDQFDEFASCFSPPSRRLSSASTRPIFIKTESPQIVSVSSYEQSAGASYGSVSCSSPVEADGATMKDGCPAMGVAYTPNGPLGSKSRQNLDDDDDGMNGEAERRELRLKYEADGWLSGPRPSRVTSLRRKRAV